MKTVFIFQFEGLQTVGGQWHWSLLQSEIHARWLLFKQGWLKAGVCCFTTLITLSTLQDISGPCACWLTPSYFFFPSSLWMMAKLSQTSSPIHKRFTHQRDGGHTFAAHCVQVFEWVAWSDSWLRSVRVPPRGGLWMERHWNLCKLFFTSMTWASEHLHKSK